jgi:hypothetical protein
MFMGSGIKKDIYINQNVWWVYLWKSFPLFVPELKFRSVAICVVNKKKLTDAIPTLL